MILLRNARRAFGRFLVIMGSQASDHEVAAIRRQRGSVGVDRAGGHRGQPVGLQIHYADRIGCSHGDVGMIPGRRNRYRQAHQDPGGQARQPGLLQLEFHKITFGQ